MEINAIDPCQFFQILHNDNAFISGIFQAFQINFLSQLDFISE